MWLHLSFLRTLSITLSVPAAMRVILAKQGCILRLGVANILEFLNGLRNLVREVFLRPLPNISKKIIVYARMITSLLLDLRMITIAAYLRKVCL